MGFRPAQEVVATSGSNDVLTTREMFAEALCFGLVSA
jgi:hypothetical protein